MDRFWIWLRNFAEAQIKGEFAPGVYFDQDSDVTEMRLQDTAIKYYPLVQIEPKLTNLGVELGYSMVDGDLIAVKVFGDVRQAPTTRVQVKGN